MHSLSNQKISFEKRTFSWFHCPLTYQEMKNQICIYFLSMAKRKTVFWNQETHFHLFTAVFSQWSTFTADCLLWKLRTLTVMNPCWDACSFWPFSQKKFKKNKQNWCICFSFFWSKQKRNWEWCSSFFLFTGENKTGYWIQLADFLRLIQLNSFCCAGYSSQWWIALAWLLPSIHTLDILHADSHSW